MAKFFVVILVSIVLGAQLPTSYSQVPNIWTPGVSACIVSTVGQIYDNYRFEDCKTLCQVTTGCKSVIYYSNTWQCQPTGFSFYETTSPCPLYSDAIFTELVARINCQFPKFDEKQKQCCEYCISVGCGVDKFKCANYCEWNDYHYGTTSFCNDDKTCCSGRACHAKAICSKCKCHFLKKTPNLCCGVRACNNNQKCTLNCKCIPKNQTPNTCCTGLQCNAGYKCSNACQCVRTCCSGLQCNAGYRCSNACQCVWNGGK